MLFPVKKLLALNFSARQRLCDVCLSVLPFYHSTRRHPRPVWRPTIEMLFVCNNLQLKEILLSAFDQSFWCCDNIQDLPWNVSTEFGITSFVWRLLSHPRWKSRCAKICHMCHQDTHEWSGDRAHVFDLFNLRLPGGYPMRGWYWCVHQFECLAEMEVSVERDGRLLRECESRV